jgi:hypothetical protein
MRDIAFVIALPLLWAAAANASGETCSGRAEACVTHWGNPRAACYEPFRMSACNKTGKYVAPNGNVWPAARSQAEK